MTPSVLANGDSNLRPSKLGGANGTRFEKSNNRELVRFLVPEIKNSSPEVLELIPHAPGNALASPVALWAL